MKKIICTAIGLFMFTGLMPLLICGKRPTISIPVNTASVSLPPAVNTSQQSKSSETPSFKILDTSTSQIISIPDREFMYGALPYEVPPTFEPEALKAQAIAIYTYFSRARKKERCNSTQDPNTPDFKANLSAGEFYLSNDQLKNKFGSSFDEHFAKIKSIVDSVFGEEIVFEDEPIIAMYHAISGGSTECCKDVFVEDIPYLKSVPSPGDMVAPGYKTTKEFTDDEFKAIASSVTETPLPDDKGQWISNIKSTPSGHIISLNLGTNEISGNQIRSLFSLRSGKFDISFQDGKVIFTVYGYGHCVGMSQYGAQYMALQGSTYKEIISWYYPGTEIKHQI